MRDVDPERVQALRDRLLSMRVPDIWLSDRVSPSECPDAPHRGPEGPNEDLGQCPRCWSPAFRVRPEGETFGYHLPDCSLPIRHESFCKPGGAGHPPAQLIRG